MCFIFCEEFKSLNLGILQICPLPLFKKKFGQDEKVYSIHRKQTYLILESAGAESPDAGKHKVNLVPLLGAVRRHIVGGEERL